MENLKDYIYLSCIFIFVLIELFLIWFYPLIAVIVAIILGILVVLVCGIIPVLIWIKEKVKR